MSLLCPEGTTHYCGCSYSKSGYKWWMYIPDNGWFEWKSEISSGEFCWFRFSWSNKPNVFLIDKLRGDV